MIPVQSISIVIPVFNEEGNLSELLRRCRAACHLTGKNYEIVLVDDGSTDNSSEIIRAEASAPGSDVVGVILNRNYGQHAAVMAGFAATKGELIVTLDADLQNPPEEIPNLVSKADEGFDIVASRRMNRKDSFFRKLSSSIVNYAARKSTGVQMTDYGCMLRAYRRRIVEAMLQCHEHSTFIPILANTFARHTTEIEVHHEARSEGTSKYSLWKLINLQFDLLTSMTTFPLRVLSVIGIGIASLGMLFGLLLFVMRILQGPQWAADGVFTLFALLFIFLGAQFVGMGFLGEYIGRIYHDVRARPRYFVEQIVGNSPIRASDNPRLHSVKGSL